MPKEKLKRGRRENKRRKLGDGSAVKVESVYEEAPPTRQHYVELDDTQWVEGDDRDESGTNYGTLSEEEQDYYREVSNVLASNQFRDTEEQDIFINNVFRESDGKEIKLACSQGCSRLLEKLVALSTIAQLKKLFQQFSGEFVNLVSHRFASHCCEAMFRRASKLFKCGKDNEFDEKDLLNGETVTLENLILFTVGELQPHTHELLWDRFATHPLRSLLILLSGRDFNEHHLRHIVRAKEGEPLSGADSTVAVPATLPDSFNETLRKLVCDSTGGMGVDDLRKASLDSIGSPMLQLLIELEGTDNRTGDNPGGDTLARRIMFPSEDGKGETSSIQNGFVEQLVQSSTGSHLLEVIIRTSPKEDVNRIFSRFIKGRIKVFSDNEPSTYVLLALFKVIDGKTLSTILKEVRPELKYFIESEKFSLINGLLESCRREEVDKLEDLLKDILSAFNDEKSTSPLLCILGFKNDSLEDQIASDKFGKSRKFQQASVLLQNILETRGEASTMIFESLLNLPAGVLVALSEHEVMSHVVEKSLILKQDDPIYRRKLFTLLSGSFGRLASHPCGSHVVDAFLAGDRKGMKIYRERIANELILSESIVRESFFGRKVWRNWQMDIYKKSQGSYGRIPSWQVR